MTARRLLRFLEWILAIPIGLCAIVLGIVFGPPVLLIGAVRDARHRRAKRTTLREEYRAQGIMSAEIPEAEGPMG